MKKIYLTIVLVLSLSLNMFSQRKDGFFNYDYEEPYFRLDDPDDVIGFPTSPIGTPYNDPAPLGDGLLILTAIGIGYTIRKRKK